jgi:transposase-like protein
LFYGKSTEDAVDWLRYFEQYATFQRMNKDAKFAYFPLLLREKAADWMEHLIEQTKDAPDYQFDDLKDDFLRQFGKTTIDKMAEIQKLWTRKQQSDESVLDYFTTMRKLARRLDISEPMLLTAILQGLKSSLRPGVIQKMPNDVDEAEAAARLIEVSLSNTSDGSLSAILDELRLSRHDNATIQAEVHSLRTALQNQRHRSPLPTPTPSYHHEDRRTVSHHRRSDSSRGVQRGQGRGRGVGRGGNQFRRQNQTVPSSSHVTGTPEVSNRGRPPRRRAAATRDNRDNCGESNTCYKCGTAHEYTPDACPAFGKTCYHCGKSGHFSRVCRSRNLD